jgi:hypothetical protein
MCRTASTLFIGGFWRRFRARIFGIIAQLKAMNFFTRESSSSSSADAQQLARISTRIYVVSFIGCMIVLAIFNGVTTVNVVETVPSPSLSIFEELYAKYPNTIKCPCQHIVIGFKDFMSLSPKYHQVSNAHR